MVYYPDNRLKFQNRPQWEIPVAMGNSENRYPCPEAKSEIAIRGGVPGQIFRVTTADVSVDTESKPPVTANPQPQLPEQPAETKFSPPTQ